MVETVAKIPEKFTYLQAATVPLTLTTAAVGLFADAPSGAGLNPTWDPKVQYVGQSAFIVGGSASVGIFVVAQICGQVNIVYDAVFSPEGQAAGYAALVDNGHLLSVRATPDAYVPKDVDDMFGKILYEKLGGLLEKGTLVPLRIEELPGGWRALWEAQSEVG
ncbi:hypothetical protein BT96DRAFT_1016156 [Gymnopus androsaceus JB14]|uniref:NAD(P)-binding protein n=1 Tax=Gymnopus androsaceus JB14 TaxID=1447944 RepID=A0A6A4I6W7_9AGAR|nr:hypothetical protein BT96DRAFT_1016156 [Gymnopus androsaceus JB14]